MFWLIASTVVATCMAILMIFIRVRTAKKPTSIKRIVLPPLMMSTGSLMFLFPAFQVKWIQVLEALLVGIIFSIPLIKSSKFEVRDDKIYLTPSKGFIFILFGLLLVRIIFKLLVGSHISLGETSGMFFLLGFGMIFTWRLAMLHEYKQLISKTKHSE